MLYKSERSGRVYSDPIDIDGDIYLEIIKSPEIDPLKSGDIIKWWEPSFPPFYFKEIN
jgi:hypothetical protein